jgi:hypothetical protein
MWRHILLYGVLAGVLVAALRGIEYRWLVIDHSLEIYGGLVAAIFATVGSASSSRASRLKYVRCWCPRRPRSSAMMLKLRRWA